MNLTATAENGRTRAELKDIISKWRETEAEFTSKIEQLIRSGIKGVHIYVSSPGGECSEASKTVNVIKEFPGKITDEDGALVASVTTYIAINCTSFPMPVSGFFVIHQVSGGAYGRVADIESALEVMRKLNKHYLNAFLSKYTGKKKIRDTWREGDYWMSTQEAKENGFVTEVAGKAKVNKAMAQVITNCGYTGEIEITDFINSGKSKDDMDLTMLTTHFGMDASTTEAQFIAQVDAWKHRVDRVGMLEKQEEARKEQEIENILDSMIKEKRVTANARDDQKVSLTSDFDIAKKLLGAIKSVEIPEVHVPSLTDATNKEFEGLQNDPEALENIVEKNPAEYECLPNDYIKRNGK